MFNDLNVLQTAAAMARHAAARQELIAENIANADTPGFKARDLESFTEYYKRIEADASVNHKTHKFRTTEISQDGLTAPNGNSVSIEDQIWKSAATARQHETAVTIYSKSLSLLRIALGSR